MTDVNEDVKQWHYVLSQNSRRELNVAKPPAFQFYAAEYLADARVQMLSLAQEGIYIRLLSYCWREGSLPCEDAALRLLAKNCPIAMLAAVKALFKVGEDGRLIHGRLEEERKKQADWREKSSNGGKKGAATRAINSASTTLQPPLQPNGNTASASASASASAKQNTCDGDLEPEMVARVVLVELALAGPVLEMNLSQICKAEMAKGTPWEALKDELVSSWREYELARSNLTYSSGAAKFFGEGVWKNRNGWPWKEGKKPAPSRKYME